MAKGAEAKELVINRIKEVFNSDYIGVFDKKVYLWSEENGERIQVALTLTCPKVPIATVETNGVDNMVSIECPKEAIKAEKAPEVTVEDKVKVEELMKILGI